MGKEVNFALDNFRSSIVRYWEQNKGNMFTRKKKRRTKRVNMQEKLICLRKMLPIARANHVGATSQGCVIVSKEVINDLGIKYQQMQKKTKKLRLMKSLLL